MTEAKNKRKGLRWIMYVFLFLFACILTGSVIRSLRIPIERNPKNTSDEEWSRRSYGYAPHPDDYHDAIIQVYAARTRGYKKAVAVHTWIATKKKGADEYIISHVFGWRLKPGGTALYREPGIPDKSWARNAPTLIKEVRGVEAELIMDKLEAAISAYPWHDVYRAWPGPNSNTFTAWVGLQVPELKLDLPATAIGKDWRPGSDILGRSVSGTGIQASFYGLLGLTAAYEEGLEVNILGLNIELDVMDLALELPGIGRVW